MVRVCAWLSLLVVLGPGACAKNSPEASVRGGNGQREAQIDPLAFVILYWAPLDTILKKHRGASYDCEGTLAELLRFVADRREEFLDQARSRPPDWQPEGGQVPQTVRSLMEYAQSCPNEVERLNRAIHSLAR